MTNEEDHEQLKKVIQAIKSSELSMEEKIDCLNAFRSVSRSMGKQLDGYFIHEFSNLTSTVNDLHKNHKELQQIIEKLTMPPLHTATYIRSLELQSAVLMQVNHNGQNYLVAPDQNLETKDLAAGDEVYLTSERNCVVAKPPKDLVRVGETAMVKRVMADGRLVIKDRDIEVVINIAGNLSGTPLKPKDVVLWNRKLMMALEQVDVDDDQTDPILEEISESLSQTLGGLDTVRDPLLQSFVFSITQPELAESYGILRANGRLLLTGPPGCGKTTLMRVVANQISKATSKRCRIATVNGAELYSPYVGETEQNIKRQVQVLDEYDGPAILFLDEIDAIGQMRGGLGNVHADRSLGTLLSELEGFSKHPGLIVIAATNRADVLDPALRERFGWEIEIPRPNRAAAREIFEIHLAKDLPYRPNGSSAGATRNLIIETAVSQFYDPNADNEVSQLQLRDGTTRTVTAGDLMSGRFIEHTCKSATERAFHRHVMGGEVGVCQEDMQVAIDDALDRLSITLTTRNAKSYLTDLPPDLDVTAVEPVRHKVRMHRYVQTDSITQIGPGNNELFEAADYRQQERSNG